MPIYYAVLIAAEQSTPSIERGKVFRRKRKLKTIQGVHYFQRIQKHLFGEKFKHLRRVYNLMLMCLPLILVPPLEISYVIFEILGPEEAGSRQIGP